jgi:hypothetical protein
VPLSTATWTHRWLLLQVIREGLQSGQQRGQVRPLPAPRRLHGRRRRAHRCRGAPCVSQPRPSKLQDCCEGAAPALLWCTVAAAVASFRQMRLLRPVKHCEWSVRVCELPVAATGDYVALQHPASEESGCRLVLSILMPDGDKHTLMLSL